MATKMSPFSASAVLFLLWILAGFYIFPVDVRTETIDAYVLVDNSEAMETSLEDATGWICDYLVDSVLIPGDRLSVWTYSADISRAIDHRTMQQNEKETVKAEIRGIKADGDAPNLAPALSKLLREARRMKKPGTMSFLVITGSLVESASPETERLLKRSKVMERPGWKAVVVGVDVDEKAAEGTKRYYEAIGTP